jgi:NADPH:quinone reductase-like Zn-dependent oxidoreductase
MPKTMKGVWVHEKTQTLKDFDIPEPQEGQVLIKVEAAAQNPKDWKGRLYNSAGSNVVPEHLHIPGSIQGSDIAGTIVKVGPGVTRVSHEFLD